MKSTLFIVVMISSLSLFAQDTAQAFRLGVKNSLKPDGKVSYFKPNRKLEVFTFEGRMYNGYYTLNHNSVIINYSNAIPINEITIVKGGIKKSNWVKVGAWALVAGGAFVGWTYYSLDRWASGWDNSSPNIGPSLPYFAISGVGASMLVINKYGVKTYETKDNWELIISKK
jgi:hypothetical protein